MSRRTDQEQMSSVIRIVLCITLLYLLGALIEIVVLESVVIITAADIMIRIRFHYKSCVFTKPQRCYSKATTVDPIEMEHFKFFSSDWWSHIGPMKPLHSMNKLRVPFIRDGILSTLGNIQNNSTPLSGVSILDVGCGGGILSESLARIGATVTGLDPNTELLSQAESHSKTMDLSNLTYIPATIDDFSKTHKTHFDCVVSSEVIEHISAKADFLRCCVECLKPGGSIFLSTINRTWIANLLVVELGENVGKIIPKGTHDPRKFMTPKEMQRILGENKCRTVLLHGLYYNPLTNDWFWTSKFDVNYILHAVKEM